jgi:hypothetical protein
VSHPFDRLRKGAWREDDLLEIVDQVDAIEVFNARCLYAEGNQMAQVFAKQHGLIGTVGSDAHIRPEYGQATLQMRPFENDPEDFLDALRTATPIARLSGAYVHLGSKAAKWTKKLGFKPRLWEGG